MVSYNIWFENSPNKEHRFNCILELLKVSRADFICLQEVTQEFMQLLAGQEWVGEYFTGLFPMGWYDTLILSRYRCRFSKAPFHDSAMGRSMTFAELVGEGQSLVVGCVHYESLDNPRARCSQIAAVQAATQDCERVVIAGDYNFSDGWPENKAIAKEFRDLWLETREGQLEQAETMPQTPVFPAWRPDHVLCKLPGDLSGASIDRLGDFTIPPYEHEGVALISKDGQVRTPSDHFGLYALLPLGD